MIKVIKKFDDIPEILKSDNREKAFKKNVALADFKYGLDLYKPSSVKSKLAEIYHNKCGYCEKDISDDPKHIEHYRPKDTYYWLAYSWDNLLFCCTRCNSKKREFFEIDGIKAIYENEKFKDIHTLGISYDKLEEPKIINPEKDDILDDIKFQNNGKIYSGNERVTHTIKEACNLNRDELVQHRVAILNDFKCLLDETYILFLKQKNIDIFEPIIKNFILKCKKENEYFAFRHFVLNNIDLFFSNKNLVKIINKKIGESI